MRRSIVLVLFLISILAANSEYTRTSLLNNWKMQIIDGFTEAKQLVGKVYDATLPTNVHLDLLHNSAIKDPYFAGNYPTVGWVSEATVKYSLTFSVDPNIFQLKQHLLVFEGIDTYSNVTLNGKNILQTANAFRKYSFEVKELLKERDNLIEVTISPPSKMIPANEMPFEYAYTRKACYQYSWDWAPYLNTLGIWKPVYIDSYQEVKLDYVWVRNRFISEEKAVINFAMVVNAVEEKSSIFSQYRISISEESQQIAISVAVTGPQVYINLDIVKPQLWWPRGIGKAFIYDFQVKLLRGATLIDSKRVPYGIRTTQLNREDKKFEVRVNGYPIYAKGANYVPPDMFYSRLENPKFKPANTIRQLLHDAADSNFNMLRIWGGGQYESDEFLELASRLGIMLFYDFMFSDSIYPSNKEFMVNVEQEIKDQVKRARNYPAIVLWCGNNEILQGIRDWGWNSKKYKNDYHRLFEQLIPKILEIESPYTPYIPSSPVEGVGNYDFQRGGDFHYWGVWAGGEAFENYIRAVGPFNSEFGTQALPVWETIVDFTTDQDRSYNSHILLQHQRHSSGFNTLKKYMEKYMKKSLTFELETYQSGLLQAFAIELAIKAQRVAKPRSFGTLYWQFNDAWPAISWSSIDYYGRWKPLQFMAKRLYPDIAIFCNRKAEIYAVNDKLVPLEALAKIQVQTFQGEILFSENRKLNLAANQVKSVLQIDNNLWKGRQDSVVVYTEIIGGREDVMSSTTFFKPFLNLDLPAAKLSVEYNLQFKQITVKSEKLVKNLYISNKKEYVKTSDNYFDVVPGHPVKVLVLNEKALKELQATMEFRSYRQVYQDQALQVSQVETS